MRLFIAIDFKNHESYFKELQEQIPTDTATIKIVNTFHLTLKFLGDVFEEKVEAVKQALSKVEFKPFELETKEIGVFPSPAYIKVVWVGFKENKTILDLQKQIEKVLEDFHFRKDFEFAPHLTLARVKFVKDKDKFVEALEKIKVKPVKEPVSEFKLIKSELTEEGPIYENLEEFPHQD